MPPFNIMLVPVKYDGARVGRFMNSYTPNFFVPLDFILNFNINLDHELYLIHYKNYENNIKNIKKISGKSDIIIDYGSIYSFDGEINAFGILPDFGVGLNVPRKLAEMSVEETVKFADGYKNYGAVVQGSKYVDLREKCAKAFRNRPIVVIANGYKLSKNPRLMIEIVTRVREILNPNVALYYPFSPPWLFPVLSLAGVDLFDMNYYILHASEGKIVLDIGVFNLGDLNEVPCTCKVCSKKSPEEYTFEDILNHSYYHAISLVKSIRESVRKGKFFEYLEAYSSFNREAMTALRILYLEKFDFIEKRTPIYY